MSAEPTAVGITSTTSTPTRSRPAATRAHRPEQVDRRHAAGLGCAGAGCEGRVEHVDVDRQEDGPPADDADRVLDDGADAPIAHVVHEEARDPVLGLPRELFLSRPVAPQPDLDVAAPRRRARHARAGTWECRATPRHRTPPRRCRCECRSGRARPGRAPLRRRARRARRWSGRRRARSGSRRRARPRPRAPGSQRATGRRRRAPPPHRRSRRHAARPTSRSSPPGAGRAGSWLRGSPAGRTGSPAGRRRDRPPARRRSPRRRLRARTPPVCTGAPRRSATPHSPVCLAGRARASVRAGRSRLDATSPRSTSTVARCARETAAGCSRSFAWPRSRSSPPGSSRSTCSGSSPSGSRSRSCWPPRPSWRCAAGASAARRLQHPTH